MTLEGTSRLIRFTVPVLLGLGILVFLGLTWSVSLHKFYAIDEFQYGHAAWLVHRGQTPFVDFFDHHFPLIYQVFAPFFSIHGQAADYLFTMRLAMLLLILVTLGSFFLIRPLNRERSAMWAAIFLLSCWPLISRMIEIRPDTLAIALVMLALGSLYPNYNPHFKGCLAGFLLTLGVWSSQKVMVYGMPFVIAFAIDLVRYFRKERRLYLGNPFAFASGSILAMLTFPLSIFLSSGFAAWYTWCIQWPMEHEKTVIGFSWLQYLTPLLIHYWWQIPLLGAGVFALVGQRRREKEFFSHPDLLLLAMLPLTFLSYTMQKVPYTYSLIPFLVVWCLVCGLGTAFLGRMLGSLSLSRNLTLFLGAGGFVVLTALIGFQVPFLRQLAADDNTYQKEMLTLVSQIAGPDDPVYDNSASTLIQPSVHFYYFTNAYIRKTQATRLAEEIPAAIWDKECTLYFHDGRFNQLNPQLKQFLVDHFFPYRGELWVFGKHFQTTNREQMFRAPREGRYFISPESAREGIVLGGKPLEADIFTLEKGEHQLTLPENHPSFYLLWLPADGKKFHPVPQEQPKFSRL